MKITGIELTMDELKEALNLYLQRKFNTELGDGKLYISYEDDKRIGLLLGDEN